MGDQPGHPAIAREFTEQFGRSLGDDFVSVSYWPITPTVAFSIVEENNPRPK